MTAKVSVLGDSRVNENPGVLSFGLILYRWHNNQADRIHREHPDWSDEDVFQATRRWVIAVLQVSETERQRGRDTERHQSIQKIILYDFLPTLLGESVPPYSRYMPQIPPGVSSSFTTAFSSMQSLMPSAMFLRQRGTECVWRTDIESFPAMRMCQNWCVTLGQ